MGGRWRRLKIWSSLFLEPLLQELLLLEALEVVLDERRSKSNKPGTSCELQNSAVFDKHDSRVHGGGPFGPKAPLWV